MKRYLLMLGLLMGCVAAGYAAEGKCCCGQEASCCAKSCSCDDCGCEQCGKTDDSGRRKGKPGATFKR